MQEFQTGAVRDTGGKGRMDLIPWCAVRRISRHMEDAIKPDPTTGKPHYPERDWEKGMPMHCMIDSAFRHLAKYVEGMTDEDHLCAAATNLLMAMWTEENRPSMQDIPSRLSVGSSLRSDKKDDALPVQAEESKENAKETICDCYRSDNHTCMGTRECDPANCGGDKSKCDYYLTKEKKDRMQKESGHQISFDEYAESLLGGKI